MENRKWKIIKLFLCVSFIAVFHNPVLAYEDCIITTDGTLTNIKIQNNDIIDVFPLITIMNNKNTLIVHPLKEGSTKFTVIKNNKDKYLFSVKINSESTEIDDVEGFDILTIDCPPGSYEYQFDLDEPPAIETEEFGTNSMLNEAEKFQMYIDNIEAPPVLRGE